MLRMVTLVTTKMDRQVNEVNYKPGDADGMNMAVDSKDEVMRI